MPSCYLGKLSVASVSPKKVVSQLPVGAEAQCELPVGVDAGDGRQMGLWQRFSARTHASPFPLTTDNCYRQPTTDTDN
jgi:hypothetical protein